MSDERIRESIQRYLDARRALLDLAERYPERIGGNDNIIGRIGEFIALRFLEWLGQTPEKVFQPAHPGFDLRDGDTTTQVKVISPENPTGKTVPLTGYWTQFVLIHLDKEYRPARIGVLTRREHERARRNDTWRSPCPTVSLGMLKENGLIRRYGRIWSADDLPSDLV